MLRYPVHKSEQLADDFSLLVESLYESLFLAYKDELALQEPEQGFLSHDCYTPYGLEESCHVFDYAIHGLFNVYHQLSEDSPQSHETSKFECFHRLTRRVLKTTANECSHVPSFKEAFSLLFPEQSDYKKGSEQFLSALLLIYNKLVELIFQNIGVDNEQTKSSILISYRDEGRGQGAFYDHYVLQKRTKHPTAIIPPNGMKISDFKSAIRNNVHGMSFGREDKTLPGKKIPPYLDLNAEQSGLLVIPGRARVTEKNRPQIHKARTGHEQEMIRQARLQGRPTLAICAGSWQLWKGYGGNEVSVNGHNNTRMLRILKSGNVGWNTQIHRIDVRRGSMLAEAMNYEGLRGAGFTIPVNSVHWLAPDPNNVPEELTVTAKTRRDNKIAPRGRTGRQLQPTERSIEAFETKHGAPMFGIQWHPEGYNRNDHGNFALGHINLLKFMAEAGDVYRNKQAVLREFKLKNSTPLLQAIGLFKRKITRSGAEKHGGRHEANEKRSQGSSQNNTWQEIEIKDVLPEYVKNNFNR